MKSRWTGMAFGIVFSVSLALAVGQRLSAEWMAVVVGVLAGVVASVPTSLVVVWFASRARVTRTPMDVPARAPAEPRFVLLPAPRPAAYPAAPADMGAYGAQSFAGYAPGPAAAGGYLLDNIHPARRFTVVGGAELVDEDVEPQAGYTQEVVTWQR